MFTMAMAIMKIGFINIHLLNKIRDDIGPILSDRLDGAHIRYWDEYGPQSAQYHSLHLISLLVCNI